MLPAVVLSQYGTRLARPGRHSALAYLAANDRKTTDGHGETAGICSAHLHPIMPDRPANAYTRTHVPAIRARSVRPGQHSWLNTLLVCLAAIPGDPVGALASRLRHGLGQLG